MLWQKLQNYQVVPRLIPQVEIPQYAICVLARLRIVLQMFILLLYKENKV